MRLPARERERGITIIMVALFIVVLFMIAAIAIDVGVLYTARTSAQHAADAAALAGAFAFVNPAPGVDPTIAAKNAAVAVAAKNGILGQTVSIAPSDVVVDRSNRLVTVTVSRLGGNGIATFFAKVMNISTADVQTKATAEALPGGANYCMKPFWIPNDIFGSCSAGQELFDSSGNITPTGQANIGSEFNLWYKVGPSQWSLIDPSSLGVSFSRAMTECFNVAGSGPVKCGSQLSAETGARVGEVEPAIQQLLGPTPDLWVQVGQYQDGSTGAFKDTSPQLVTSAVWDDCPPNAPITPGRQQFTVAGYATIFIESLGSPSPKRVNARLVGLSSCAAAGVTDGSGPFGYRIRLVQTPP